MRGTGLGYHGTDDSGSIEPWKHYLLLTSCLELSLVNRDLSKYFLFGFFLRVVAFRVMYFHITIHALRQYLVYETCIEQMDTLSSMGKAFNSCLMPQSCPGNLSTYVLHAYIDNSSMMSVELKTNLCIHITV